MITISNALSAGQAETYYQQDYMNKTEDYYTEQGELKGFGLAAWPRSGN